MEVVDRDGIRMPRLVIGVVEYLAVEAYDRHAQRIGQVQRRQRGQIEALPTLDHIKQMDILKLQHGIKA